MSIVALKKNSRRFIDPISGGAGPFSLNGCRRNIGQVGPTDLGSYTNKYGAACNCTSNDDTVVKKSVMNTRGMLTTKFLCTNPDDLSCYKNWVTPMGSDHFSQGEYLKNKSTHSLSVRNDSSDFNAGVKLCNGNGNGSGSNCNNNYNINNNLYKKNWLNKKQPSTYAKDLRVATSYEEYMKNKLMKKHCLPPCKNKPFPMYLHNGGCSEKITKIEDAIRLGYLKEDCCIRV
jgi:hypothetical protein